MKHPKAFGFVWNNFAGSVGGWVRIDGATETVVCRDEFTNRYHAFRIRFVDSMVLYTSEHKTRAAAIDAVQLRVA